MGPGTQGGLHSTITYRNMQPPRRHAALTCHLLMLSCKRKQKECLETLEHALHKAKGMAFLELGSSQVVLPGAGKRTNGQRGRQAAGSSPCWQVGVLGPSTKRAPLSHSALKGQATSHMPGSTHLLSLEGVLQGRGERQLQALKDALQEAPGMGFAVVGFLPRS